MSSIPTSTEKTFAGEFLKHYLQSGIGSMSKTDIDALVMHLLDKHGEASGRPLGDLSNQVASERLRAPLAKIKRLRYEGCLKFGGTPEDEARSRFIRLLNNVSLEFDKKEGSVAKIVFVVEDVLAKNWIQGQIKKHGGIFDGSFNTEIIKVDPELFVQFLHKLLPDSAVDDFESKYNQILRETNRDELAKRLRALISSFATGAAKAGGTAAAVALLALPIFGG